MPMKNTARRKLLNAAATRFYADGIAATGIDTIIQSAGVAKMSLYNNFGSKAELVAAYIEERHGEWLDLYQKRLEGSQNPEAGVLAVVDAYIDHAEMGYTHGFRGCGLLNAAAELPAGHEGRITVAAHKQQVEDILRGHLLQLDQARAGQLAEHISYLLEGTMSRAGLESSSKRLFRAREMIAALLAQA